jgi:hypothetical protein
VEGEATVTNPEQAEDIDYVDFEMEKSGKAFVQPILNKLVWEASIASHE